MSFAFVFAGQGSQSVGMLGALALAAPAVRPTFDEASRVLGYDLWQLVSAGPEEALNATEHTQPAMLAAGVAVWRAWRARGGALPAVASGHSLGEFTALVCAGALDYPAAIELVRFRGQVMQEAVPAGTGAMAAILGLDDDAVIAVCREAAGGAVVEAVNFNCPGQVVIAVTLPVSVPSHSSLMRGAAEKLRAKLGTLTVRAPAFPYVSAVDARPHSEPADIVDVLVRQISSPVRWTDALRALLGYGVAQVIECGPGKVLTTLNRRIERRPDLSFLALEDPASIDTALSATGAASHA